MLDLQTLTPMGWVIVIFGIALVGFLCSQVFKSEKEEV